MNSCAALNLETVLYELFAKMEELHLRYHMQFCWLFAFQHGQEELADTKSIGRPSVSGMF